MACTERSDALARKAAPRSLDNVLSPSLPPLDPFPLPPPAETSDQRGRDPEATKSRLNNVPCGPK